MTILDYLIAALRKAAVYNRHDQAGPCVVLWTDGERLWSKSIPLLRDAMPELLVLDPSCADARQGPSTLIRYSLAREVWRETPVIYMPGVSRQAFRGAVGFPEEARHLYALQYQGEFWTQLNGKDWTPSAFLSSEEGGLGLDLARDKATLEALIEQLGNILRTPLPDLQGCKLEAADFHELAASDPIRLLLQWLASPEPARAEWEAERWKGFLALCKKNYGFDPEKDGVIVAVEKLVDGQGAWQQVWRRYREAPKAYAGVRKLLDPVEPKDLIDNANERIPANNKRREGELRRGLTGLGSLPKAKALEALEKLCAEHASRANSLWAELGEAPLACAAAHLVGMVAGIRAGVPGNDWPSLAMGYIEKGWVTDVGAWKALAAVRDAPDQKAVTAALRAVYVPWLEELSRRTEDVLTSYPNPNAALCRTMFPTPGTAVVFADGLRCDLCQELRLMLEENDLKVDLQPAWSALPTVTATAKPAWRPLAERLKGDAVSEGFEPQVAATSVLLKTQAFRTMLGEVGWTWLEASAVGDPAGSCWTEAGAFDHYGHEQGARLAWRIEEELRAVALRVRELLSVGWKKVVVVTDHGWLMVPDGLPKVALPTHLTVSKWGRCAITQPGAQHGQRQVPWFWGGEHAVVLAPGISVFKEGLEYAHGGASLQETLTPILTVILKAPAPNAAVRIDTVKWFGLRLQVQLDGATPDLALDLRRKPADASSSLLGKTPQIKVPDDAGKASFIVENEDLAGQAAVLVVLRSGQVICKQTVTIGED